MKEKEEGKALSSMVDTTVLRNIVLNYLRNKKLLGNKKLVSANMIADTKTLDAIVKEYETVLKKGGKKSSKRQPRIIDENLDMMDNIIENKQTDSLQLGKESHKNKKELNE